MLYQAYQAQRDLTAPATAVARLTVRALAALPEALAGTGLARLASATGEMVSLGRLRHERPPFGIDTVEVGGRAVAVREEIAATSPFATLLHFAKDVDEGQPRVLVVAALAGHFSTLLRPTVQALLPDHDVYLTDWHNARDVPLEHGPFGFDDYVDHVVRFLGDIGPGAHLLAVCQPCPASLAAVAAMSEAGDPAVPRSVTLMAGPVDTSASPTVVNDLASSRPLTWFEGNLLTRVPLRYRGAGRRVYPGFLQLGAFASMNLDRHVDRQLSLFRDLVAGDQDAAAPIWSFYDEYFAVLDIHAEFYLETVDRVFQRNLLARGELTWHGRPVDPGAISGVSLLTVEGGRDDVCGIGQTMAAQGLCRNVPAERKRHHLQPGVGHYGVFSGRAWEREIYPVVREVIREAD